MYTYQLRQRGEEFTIILQKALTKYKGVTVLREGVTCVSEEYDVIVKVDPEVLTKFSGSTTIGKIYYEVHKGPKGGYYIWKEKTRGPHKGDCYKKYVTGTSFARSEEKDPTILEALVNIIAGVCKSSWEYETKYEWSDENSEFWIGLLNNEFDPQDPDPDDIPGEDDGGDGFGDGGDGFGDGEAVTILSVNRSEKRLPSPGVLSAVMGIFSSEAASPQRYSPRPLDLSFSLPFAPV